MIGFPSLKGALRQQIREARVDHSAFEMPLRICELSECRATCCHDGVYLDEEEHAVIGKVVLDHSTRLAQYGWHSPSPFERKAGRWKSRTEADPSVSAAFPGHFPKTRCVFLDDQHRCVLQRLSSDEGHHPWFWKPVSCWMHPLVLRPGTRGARPLLTLATSANDPAAQPGYPGFSSFTPCGAVCLGASPARETLRSELSLLGEIADRDLNRELSSTATS